MDPLFSAVSTSAKHLWGLLRCVGFNSKAQVSISSEGIRFTVEDSQVMQGIAFLDRALFTTYTFNPPRHADDLHDGDDQVLEIPAFEISLVTLLETLQIFGINDSTNRDRWSTRNELHHSTLESRPILGLCGLCRLSYGALGDPLCIRLEETGVATEGELTTYEPSYPEEIPLQKDAIVQKVIMPASWLHDAVLELSSTQPTRLTMISSPRPASLTLSCTGPLGSAQVEFSKDPGLLETFQVSRRTANTYKYSMIKSASRAMAAASKVSIRTDIQGVLSLQFMIGTDQQAQESGSSFVDFRFVPYLDEDEDEAGGDSD